MGRRPALAMACMTRWEAIAPIVRKRRKLVSTLNPTPVCCQNYRSSRGRRRRPWQPSFYHALLERACRYSMNLSDETDALEMNRDLFVGDHLPDFIYAPRTDAIYNAHGYLTKVPVDGILPYLNCFT